MSYCIYAIIDPRNDQVFYIGHSASFKRRCEQHVQGQDSLSGLTIRQIKQNGFVPLFIRLEVCKDKQSALMAEIFWIELFKSRGAKLSNVQGFDGYEARANERGKQTKKLNKMITVQQFENGLEQLANGRPVRQGKGWTAGEDKRLLSMKKKNMSYAAMADRLGRSITSIRMRLQSLTS